MFVSMLVQSLRFQSFRQMLTNTKYNRQSTQGSSESTNTFCASHLELPRLYPSPVKCESKLGQVVWIDLESQQHMFCHLGNIPAVPLPASTDPIIETITPEHRHKSRVAAKPRASAEVQRGIGNIQHVRSMQASAVSCKDICGEEVASKLRET